MIESWKVDSNELMKKMNVTEKGLSDEQVLQIREKVGENLLEEAKKKSVLQVFLSQFCDLLVIILIIAAVISAFSENPHAEMWCRRCRRLQNTLCSGSPPDGRSPRESVFGW